MAAGNLELLQEVVRALPATLNYNDFHWTNLAISRDGEPRAIVFDYHLLGIGLAFSDIRNVTGELGDAARIAFRQSYGRTDEREAVVDAPLATLYALDVAVQRPRLPEWAQPLVREIDDGVFEANLRRGIEEVH